MRRFLPLAALLGVALVLGCQDLGSGGVGPHGPQFDKRSTGPCPVPRLNGHTSMSPALEVGPIRTH